MSETMRRAVVTGMGAITPVGSGVQETWKNLTEGKNGIAPITLFDTENYKAKLAAEAEFMAMVVTVPTPATEPAA